MARDFAVIVIQKYAWDVGDILTANYITEFLGVATVETNAIRKEAGFDGNFTYGTANIATNKRNLMNADELLKLDNNKAIIMIRGRKPFICNKYDYSEHPESNKLQDMTLEEQKERFKGNMESSNKSIEKDRKIKYSFKDF